MHDFTAKKKFGQNFLVDRRILARLGIEVDRIINTHNPTMIIEVGPGTGQLTELLLKTGHNVTAIEIDRDALGILTDRFESYITQGRFNLVYGDGLDLLERGDPLFSDDSVLIANLPFNVGSRILVELWVIAPHMPLLVILQKEVTQKVSRNTPITFFGAWMNYMWDCEVVFDIPRHAFRPQPDVVSSLLTAAPRPDSRQFDIQYRQRVKAMLKVLFAHPRKTVSGNLRYAGWDQDMVYTMLADGGFDPNIRLTWDTYQHVLEACLTVAPPQA